MGEILKNFIEGDAEYKVLVEKALSNDQLKNLVSERENQGYKVDQTAPEVSSLDSEETTMSAVTFLVENEIGEIGNVTYFEVDGKVGAISIVSVDGTVDLAHFENGSLTKEVIEADTSIEGEVQAQSAYTFAKCVVNKFINSYGNIARQFLSGAIFTYIKTKQYDLAARLMFSTLTKAGFKVNAAGIAVEAAIYAYQCRGKW